VDSGDGTRPPRTPINHGDEGNEPNHDPHECDTRIARHESVEAEDDGGDRERQKDQPARLAVVGDGASGEGSQAVRHWTDYAASRGELSRVGLSGLRGLGLAA